jgi:hypothetical protein
MERGMRRNPTPAITSKMYRDFAVTTVAITALIALFASGEKDDALAAEANPVVHMSPKAKATPKAEEVDPADGDSGSWGSDVDFGHPTSSIAFDAGSWTPADGPWQPDLAAPVASHDGEDSLTAAERDQLARAAAQGAPPDQQG